jgi:predicted nuclease of restriction endonuclease-like (RecB) superfamily
MSEQKLSQYQILIAQISDILEQARNQVVRQINTTIIQTYRNIGKYLVEYEQKGAERAEYGTGLIERISQDLTKKFGKGFSERSLWKFKQFYITFQDSADTVGRIQNVGWSHIVRIMHLKDTEEQKFYLIETSKEKRSLRELDRQINSALYERLALSKDKDKVMRLAKEGEIIETGKDLVRDPYILEFLELSQHHSYTEKDLEMAIISNLQMFLLEMGKGFAFVARQKRIRLDIDDFYIDLVFYNRLLRCHLLIDLKI